MGGPCMSRLPVPRRFFAVLTLASFLFAAYAIAQTVSGSITGIALDPSSLPVAGATVTLTNRDTGVATMEQTRSNGEFTFAAVLPGRYAVAVEMKGFKRAEKIDLNLSAAERLSA